MRKAVFLDRDNTIIRNDGDLGDPAQVVLLDGAAEAIAALRELNFHIVVITNQGGVARGRFSEADVESVHQRIAERVHQTCGVAIDRFYYCPYHPEGSVAEYRRDHPWRKPRPGMILQAASDLDIDLTASWTIGDQLRDIQAGRAAGTQTILVSGNGKPTKAAEDESDVRRAKNLLAAVELIRTASRPTDQIEIPARTDVMSDALRDDGRTHELLNQIVRELRHRRADFGDFSWIKLVAAGVQIITIGCVIFALFQMREPAFYRWMSGAILGQVTVIAALLYRSPR